MNERAFAFAAALLVAPCAPMLAPMPAQAQLSNMLSGAMGSTSGGGGLGGLTGMAQPSVGAASPTNLAGLLQYCVQNNYLGGATTGSASAPSTVQQSLLSKFTGSSTPPANDSSYTAGANGDLSTGNGQNVALGGTGLKAQLTQRVCAQVLSHAKSML